VSSIETFSRELVQLVRGLRELHSAVTAASPLAVDTSSAAVLARLGELGPLRLSTLAAALCLDISTVSRQVPVLERQGWVTRKRDPEDQRAQLLQLTDAGRAVLEGVRRSRAEAFAAQLHRFNNDVTNNRQAIVLAATGSDAR
jgi:DNA-binding MarR family transcriptional regulator